MKGKKRDNFEIYLGDCLPTLEKFPSNSIDLIITSPPYADRRIKTYGGTKPEEYVEEETKIE